MGVCFYSIFYGAWRRVAAAYVKNGGEDPASSRTAISMAWLAIVNAFAT
jgi:hypothetical protein